MGAQLWNLFVDNFRMWFLSILGQWVGLFVCCIMMERRRKLNILVVWLVIKTLVNVMLLQWITERFLGQNLEYYVNFIVSFWFMMVTIALFCRTFQGGCLKVILGLSMSEVLISIIVLPSIMLVNLLEGRETLTAYSGAFELLDGLVWVIAWGLVLLVYPFASLLLKRYRTWKPRHPRLLAGLLIAYISSSQMTDTWWFIEQSYMFWLFVLLHLIFVAAALIGGWYLNWRHQLQISEEQNYLQLQLRLLENHYGTLQKQIIRMENSRRLIDRQMEELMISLEQDQTTEGRKKCRDRMEAYLKELRQAYEEIRSGVYCGDWLIDAVLCCEEETARRQGILVEYEMNGYDRGSIPEERLVRLLFGFLDFGIRQNDGVSAESKRLSLHMSSGKERLVLEFCTAAEGRIRFPKRLTADCIKQYGGTFQKRKEKGGLRILLTLKR